MDSVCSRNPTKSVLTSLEQLVEEANRGNLEVLAQITRVLDRYPEIWRHYGDVAKHTQAKWLDLIAGNEAVVRESVARTIRDLKSRCLKAGDSPLERLLVDRIVVGQLMVTFFDAALAVAIDAPESRIRFLQQQLDRAQKRHIAAVKGLADVRSMLA